MQDLERLIEWLENFEQYKALDETPRGSITRIYGEDLLQEHYRFLQTQEAAVREMVQIKVQQLQQDKEGEGSIEKVILDHNFMKSFKSLESNLERPEVQRGGSVPSRQLVEEAFAKDIFRFRVYLAGMD